MAGHVCEEGVTKDQALFLEWHRIRLGQMWKTRTCLEVIKCFSCSTQLSMKFFLLINVKMPTFVGILTFMSGKNSILGLSEPKKSRIS